MLCPFVAPYPFDNLPDRAAHGQVFQISGGRDAPFHIQFAGPASGTWERRNVQFMIRSKHLDQISRPEMHSAAAIGTTHGDQHAVAGGMGEALIAEFVRGWMGGRHVENITRTLTESKSTNTGEGSARGYFQKRTV